MGLSSKLDIAGVALAVDAEGPAAELVAALASLYPAGTASPALELRLLPRSDPDGKGYVEILESNQAERIELDQPLSGRIDLDRATACFAVDPSPNPVFSALRLTFSVVALRHDVLWLHSLGVLSEGRAFLFSGPSGSGKSTLGRTVSADTLLADESVAVRWEAGQPVACSTPFQSTGCTPPPHREGALAMIHLLVRGLSTTTRPLGSVEALARLWRCIFSLERSLVAQRTALGLVSALVQAVAVRELAFTLEPGVLHKAMSDDPRVMHVAP